MSSGSVLILFGVMCGVFACSVDLLIIGGLPLVPLGACVVSGFSSSLTVIVVAVVVVVVLNLNGSLLAFDFARSGDSCSVCLMS